MHFPRVIHFQVYKIIFRCREVYVNQAQGQVSEEQVGALTNKLTKLHVLAK